MEMEKRVAFIRKRMTPVAQAITISITIFTTLLSILLVDVYKRQG